ncbi:MAG TPA: VOC family protein [Candidatus Latescibacteria bacterium]|nr:VOC family protein [Candidatus Latescibacterota bacterium]HOS64517.1 VOC family protein [Candidatus Latescibacterota bacterium]HPK74008.1 VOC family protein [Candidatus Latescibacterota bacterium]
MYSMEHVALAAKDTRTLANWYERVLGFKIVYESENEPKAFFLQDSKGMAIEIVPPLEDGNTVDANANHLAIWVDDFDRACADLSAKGVVLEPELTNPFFGKTRIAFFNDCEGHRLQIIWRVRRIGE